MTTPDAAREIDRERLAKAVATCVSVPAWSGMSEPRRMACRQAVGFILADLTAQGFLVIRREDLSQYLVGTMSLLGPEVCRSNEALFARLASAVNDDVLAALTGQAGEKP